MTIETIKSKTVGLVLSGGGVKGVAHIGLIQALDELGIKATVISGSSIGALIGALYANGNTVAEMLTFFRETPLFDYHFITLHKPGLLDTERYYRIFKKRFPDDSFDALRLKLFVAATNLQNGELELFSKGELIRPLLASAALPPVFSPVEINGYLYADGGILNNFPLEPLTENCDFIIGSNVSGIKEVGKEAIRTSLQLTNRTTALMVYASNRHKFGHCSLIFEPNELECVGTLDKKGLEKAYTIGYEYASKRLHTILAPSA